MSFRIASLALTAALISAPAFAAAEAPAPKSGTYQIDPTHRYIAFSYSHLGYSNPIVTFDDFTATLKVDAANPSKSSVEVTIQAASVHSGVTKFDDHLKSADFFEAAKYPTISFRSTKVEKTGANKAKVTGDLTIKDKTLPVTLDVVLNSAADHPRNKKAALGFSATTKVSRTAFGLSMATPYVGDEVSIRIETEFHKAD